MISVILFIIGPLLFIAYDAKKSKGSFIYCIEWILVSFLFLSTYEAWVLDSVIPSMPDGGAAKKALLMAAGPTALLILFGLLEHKIKVFDPGWLSLRRLSVLPVVIAIAAAYIGDDQISTGMFFIVLSSYVLFLFSQLGLLVNYWGAEKKKEILKADLIQKNGNFEDVDNEELFSLYKST